MTRVVVRFSLWAGDNNQPWFSQTEFESAEVTYDDQTDFIIVTDAYGGKTYFAKANVYCITEGASPDSGVAQMAPLTRSVDV